MHPYVLYNSQDLEAAQVPSSRRVAKKAVVHLHNGILHSSKNKGKLTFFNSMDGLRGYYTTGNKLIRERLIACVFPLYVKSNKQN